MSKHNPLIPSEIEFTEMVEGLAKLKGWLFFHPDSIKTSKGKHFTPMTGDPGFPDCVIARDGDFDVRVIFAELKVDGNQPRPSQIAWLSALSGLHRPYGAARVYVWDFSQWDGIVKVLSDQTKYMGPTRW